MREVLFGVKYQTRETVIISNTRDSSNIKRERQCYIGISKHREESLKKRRAADYF